MIARVLMSLLLVAGGGWSRQANSSFQSKTREVILDVVVRNKHGAAVDDLKPEDFRVYEDGKQREVASVGLIDSSTNDKMTSPSSLLGNTAIPATAGTPLDKCIVSLVFDRLSLNEQQNARRAVDELLSHSIPPGTYVGVFVLDRRLYVLQSFTNDLQLVREAANQALKGVASQYVRESQDTLSRLEELYLKDSIIGMSLADVVTLRALREEMGTTRYQQGRSQLDALLSLVRYQNILPGRKAILYFSQGLVVPLDFRNSLQDLIGTANHDRVAFYSIDVRGLSAAPANEMETRLTHALEAGGLSRDEWQPETLRSEFASTQNNLRELAEKTSGFLVANSNNFGEPLRRIWDDLHLYYEVSYRPAWDTYDGTFHRTVVRLDRPGLEVQSREGYYALPQIDGRSMLPYEAVLMERLRSREPCNNLHSEVAIVCYRSQIADRCILILNMPLSGLKYAATGKHRTADLAFFALVRDLRSREVVTVLSRNIAIDLPSSRPDSLPLGTFTRTETFDLKPGTYTLEIAIQDRRSSMTSVKRVSVQVPSFEGLSAMQVIRARDLSPRSGLPDPGDPLEIPGSRITPEASSVIEKRPHLREMLFFVIYPDKMLTPQVTATTEVIGDQGETGIPVQTVIIHAQEQQMGLPALASLPVDGLQPGNYLFKSVITQGNKSLQTLYPFQIVNTSEK